MSHRWYGLCVPTENQLWGALRIHGELHKLGFDVAQSTAAKYMDERRGPPSQGGVGTFLRNHAPDVAAMDLFVVPTIGFKLLYGFVIVRTDRRGPRKLNRRHCTNQDVGFWVKNGTPAAGDRCALLS